LLAQLKLIRAMQQQVNQQTLELSQADEPWSENTVSRHMQLVELQRELGDMIQQLLEEPQADAPPDVPPLDDPLDSLDRALRQDPQTKESDQP
jgi:hypothetical protein